MFWLTVSQGKSACSWKTSAACPEPVRGGAPPTSTSPAVGRSRPASRLSVVDFPLPDAPTRQTNSPGATTRSTSASTTGPDP